MEMLSKLLECYISLTILPSSPRIYSNSFFLIFFLSKGALFSIKDSETEMKFSGKSANCSQRFVKCMFMRQRVCFFFSILYLE